MSTRDPATLARAFIADEGTDTKPKFWTMNHHHIVPIAAKLARDLGLDIAETSDWEIRVALPEKDSGQRWYNALRLHLRMNPSRSPEWLVTFQYSTKVSYSHFGGKTDLHEDGIPPIDKLTSFPTWLRSLAEEHGLDYDTDIDAMNVACGRKRTDKKRIRDWVLSGGAPSNPG
ncbi:MAG: hypothetical protein VX874_07440 [Pseudomonadota bacterium]|nr:hypothetical protein [Pseudomonadota bacterium]